MSFADYLPKAYKLPLAAGSRRRLAFDQINWMGYDWRLIWSNYAYKIPRHGLGPMKTEADAKALSWCSLITLIENFIGLLLIDWQAALWLTVIGFAINEMWDYYRYLEKAKAIAAVDRTVLMQATPFELRPMILAIERGYQTLSGSSGVFNFLAGAIMYLNPRRKSFPYLPTFIFPAIVSFFVLFSDVALWVLEQVTGEVGVDHTTHAAGFGAGYVAAWVLSKFVKSRPLMVWNPFVSFGLGVAIVYFQAFDTEGTFEFIKNNVK